MMKMKHYGKPLRRVKLTVLLASEAEKTAKSEANTPHIHGLKLTVNSRRPTIKRQRTVTSNSDTSSKRSQSPETEKTLTGKNGSKLRGAAARNNREKEIREKVKQDAAAQRAEAASKRNARSERRRVDGERRHSLLRTISS